MPCTIFCTTIYPTAIRIEALRYLTKRGSNGFTPLQCISHRELKEELHRKTYGTWNDKTNLEQTRYEDFNWFRIRCIGGLRLQQSQTIALCCQS